MSKFNFLKPNKVEMYRTTDGKNFENLKDAESHQKMLECKKYLEISEYFIHGSLQGIEDIESLVSFLKKEQVWIKPLMGWIDQHNSSDRPKSNWMSNCNLPD